MPRRAAAKPTIQTSVTKVYLYYWKCSDCVPAVASPSYNDYREAKRERDEHNAKLHPERAV